MGRGSWIFFPVAIDRRKPGEVCFAHMTLPLHKTKIICTIGPASDSIDMLRSMMSAGMNVARLNFSHGDLSGHGQVIRTLRAAAEAEGRRIAVMADLPGPKLRIGRLAREPVELLTGGVFTLTTEETLGNEEKASVDFQRLPGVVKQGDMLFLNDGYIQLEVIRVEGSEIRCRVIVGGEIRSHKGLNLPDIDLGIGAFTEHDHQCMEFALENGVDAVSQSFVESAKDIEAVRDAARSMGYNPFLIAKIERSRALEHMGDIIQASDGIMIARGDLGVEIPIEEMAVVQKNLMRQANAAGKPVITATQMLESMTEHLRPTRAEATDVANAVLDGTDCLMLSGETAMGKYPVQAVKMLSRIASVTEPHRAAGFPMEALKPAANRPAGMALRDLIALCVETTVQHASPAAIVVPSRSGATARSIARFRLPQWITAVSPLHATCQNLLFSYGVVPVLAEEHPQDWRKFARDWLAENTVPGDLVILTEGPSPENPDANHRMEILDLSHPSEEDVPSLI